MSDYEIRSGIMSVKKNLRQDFDLSFDQACSDLLQAPEKDLVINLAGITYLSSTYIGMVAATYFQAQSMGKSLTIQSTPEVLQILRSAGFEGFIALKKAD